MDKDANPKTANGKRGLYSEGMNNNMNKAVRCLEDITTAFLIHGHPMFCDEGQVLLEAAQVFGEAVKQLTVAYNNYAPKNGTGLMTQGGAKVQANVAGQVLLIEAQRKAAKEATKPTKGKKNKK